MTPEAFKAREFYQGVCRSYADIRSEGRVPIRKGPAWRGPFRLLKRTLFPPQPATSGNSLQAALSHAFNAGRGWHREQVRASPKLLEWVLKPDYFDYRLPEGWERQEVNFQ